MASSTTFSYFLLLALLAASLHVHARDSQFFSKVTSNNIPKEVLPTKQQEPLNKQEQEPNFVPLNQQNPGGYGLNGHESGQLPPTTENLPYRTQTENSYNKESNPNLVDGLYYNNDANVNTESYSSSNNGDQFRNNEAYVTNQQGMSDTRFMENAYTTPITSNNNGDRYYNNDAYVTKPQGMNNNNNDNNYNGENMYNNREHDIGEAKLGVTNGNNYNNGGNMYENEKNGMSDTRVMENGRYYYDLNTEKNYNLNNYNNNLNENSRSFNSRNEYANNRGNYRNSFKGQNGNNENFMEGYNGNQEEFQEVRDEQFMP
ncbi:hypothetical protein DCAR_0209050 [Daucus carota subsp. sativus]|uniref:Uncharacterized protein n=1 Tax=Daucus carota subsp. sativus TaxID=79200 RepID=A0A161XIZ6_DAUCS|nr:PREDICTED: protein E6 [Daucus carota subsp. sativus]WOG89811.1 hypothetical protein DCAR_0209050 [Daucus carota subsp. sativus]